MISKIVLLKSVGGAVATSVAAFMLTLPESAPPVGIGMKVATVQQMYGKPNTTNCMYYSFIELCSIGWKATSQELITVSFLQGRAYSWQKQTVEMPVVPKKTKSKLG
jgi:hypothetical protein